ncbi:MAG: isocitrate lyase/PEP mutase family protein [Candidatus Methylomirabilota bacterium]
MGKGKALRALLARPGVIIAPGVYDALSARICEMAGFEAVSHSGYGTAASMLGQPDIGLLDMTEMVRQVGATARAVEIPVLGDADTGFGNAINAHRTVQEYIRAGAAGLFIEDQVLPKRCGHMRGKQVISKPEMLGKLRAAMAARDEADPDFVIMCRIDAIAVNGFADALDRAKAAADLGVDMIFVEALETREQMERVGREIALPLMLNLIEGGRTPLISYAEAEALGFKYIVPALTCLSAAAKGMYEVMRRVRNEGVSNAYADRLFTMQEFAQVVHLERFRQMEETYLPAEVLEERYRGEDRHIV